MRKPDLKYARTPKTHEFDDAWELHIAAASACYQSSLRWEADGVKVPRGLTVSAQTRRLCVVVGLARERGHSDAEIAEVAGFELDELAAVLDVTPA